MTKHIDVEVQRIRRIPVLQGKIYCSPGCGFKCTKADYDKAHKMGKALARKLGKGWKHRVWENGHWCFDVIKGHCAVHANIARWKPGHPTLSYTAYFNTPAMQFIGEHKTDPKKAVAQAVAKARLAVSAIDKAIEGLVK